MVNLICRHKTLTVAEFIYEKKQSCFNNIFRS